MEHICKTCYENPGSHSFTILSNILSNIESQNIDIFYTKISNAKKYNDSDGIIDHYTNYLNFINPDSWIWIIDFEGFEMKHYLERKTTNRIANLIKSYGKLNQIIIINSNSFVKLLINITKPILSDLKHKLFIFSKNDKEKLKNHLYNLNFKNDIINYLTS